MNKDFIDRLKEKVKRRIGIAKDDVSQDDLIEEQIEDLIVEVLEYCKLKELPKALEPFIKTKVTARIKGGMTGVVGPWDEAVKSISRGDTTITMINPNERFTDKEIELLEEYKPRKVIVK